MRSSASLGKWSRRDTVVTGVAAVVAAAFAAGSALADVLHAPWLKSWGPPIAAVFAFAFVGWLLWVKVGRARLESRIEDAQVDRRLRTKVLPVGEVDPLDIGVERASQNVLPGGSLPTYVARDRDPQIRDAVTAALAGRGPWLVVVSGPSKVGKSRTLFEALRAAGGPVRVVAPVDGDAVKALLLPGSGLRLPPGPAVLWLDDLEPFLNQGVTWQTLREWHATATPDNPRFVVATNGGKGNDRIVGNVAAGLVTTAGEVLQNAAVIALTATTDAEVAADFDQRTGATSEDRAEIHRFGLAAFLVAGPALKQKLDTGIHGPGEPPCPDGLALVNTVADWARCGRTDPLPDDLAQQLIAAYWKGSIRAPAERIAEARTWATRPVAGNIALLTVTPTGNHVDAANGYTAYDYVVRLHRTEQAPPDAVWHAAISTATPEQAESVGATAYYTNRFTDAIAACQRLIDTYGNDPALREPVANAIHNQGVALGRLGHADDAIATYQRVIDTYSNDPALRELVANSHHNQGFVLKQAGRTDDAIATYQRVIDTYGNDLALRNQVAKAIVNQGVALERMGRAKDAIVTYQRVIDTYSNDPALREPVAKAIVNQGVALRQEGRVDDAVATYQQVIDAYGDNPGPALREQVAKAIHNLGVALGQTGRANDAIATYQRLIDTYDNDPALRNQVAKAMTNQGVILGQAGRANDAIATYQRLIDTYGDDPECAEAVSRARQELAGIDNR